MHHLPPFGGEHLYVAWLYRILPDIADVGPCDACFLHSLKVVLHALDRNIVAHPIPIYSHTLFFGDVLELVGQRVGVHRPTNQAAQTEQPYG